MSTAERPATRPLYIGISACLLGERVRYDGGHKRNELLTEKLAKFMTFLPVCPEVELGLPVPRNPIQLKTATTNLGPPNNADIRLVAPATGQDLTREMTAYAANRAFELAGLGLHGYVFKASSPSCGLYHVPVQDERGQLTENGRGIFANALTNALPNLPITQEDDLTTSGTCDAFIRRAFAYRRLRKLFSGSWQLDDVRAFQAREKMLLWVHDPAAPMTLTDLIDNPDEHDAAGCALAKAYENRFLAALSGVGPTDRHVKVLRSFVEALNPAPDAAGRASLNQAIKDYCQGAAPLGAPLALVRNYLKEQGKIGVACHLAEQSYLYPHPCELLAKKI